MEESQTDLLANRIIQGNGTPRKKMLPLWIKIFSWFFLIVSFFIPIFLLLGIKGNNVKQALYGLKTNDIFSGIGIFIMTLFIIKGITAFGFLKEKDWAMKIGIADAIIGIIICILVMLYPMINSGAKFSLRLELILLIPYLIKLLKIKTKREIFGQS